ncbi:hypothetical protein, variant [Puccinia triticina 1-1 BBBD Race 1]|uniref:Uncharacterized protein n=2 Tax=Puccinia triticina TaxID=208348 RepID=A0A0C4EJ34_PUCT1|nr:uncharacterized protein PtA15_2A875 [Puccinia triticina]OAV92606.1 hypothetical protein PTTG_00751 [Puccinia triticina 1-1 BBBD Race 1]OAV92607.1 hypothetical protein, variant [Puccinia triticina 1-1 BBBD Race 1]WAQ82558.1 hypothetical protein PtA15_2A875 [Puccinia triticina]
MPTDTLYYSSSYSLEPTNRDLNRHVSDRRIQPEVLSRQRSVTIDSTTGSSVETVTGLRLMARSDGDDRVLHLTHSEESPQPSFHKPTNGPGRHTLSINQPPPSALTRPSLLPHLPVRLNREADREPVSPGSCYSTSSSMVGETSRESGDGDGSRAIQPEIQPTTPAQNPCRKELRPARRTERKLSVSRPASIDSESLSPLEIRPRLIHHSPPPWSMDGGLDDEACADEMSGSGGYSSRSDGAQIRPSDISPNHQFPHIRHHLKPTPKRSSAGLGKLFKSVKASLRSMPGSGSTLDLPGSPASANRLDDQGSQQGWPTPDQTKSSSLKSVDVDCRTALAQQESDPLDISMAHDQEESNKPLPRSVSSCSYSTVDSPTTSTSHSPSITPSSSLFSLPAIGSDCQNRNIPGWHHDLKVNRKTDSKGQLPLLINSLDAGQPHSPSPNGSPNMSTQTAFTHSPPSASCFGNSYASNNIHGRREHPKLKLKASFGFLHNIKRAVGGVDHSLSFSFHNNSTTFLTTNTISLPFGTVLRNNGMDPLPHCHPLPLKPSQSSPSSLNYPASLPPRLEQAAHFVPPAQRPALSTSNPDFFDDQQYVQSAASNPIRPQKSPRRTEEGSLCPPRSQHRTNDDTLHPPKSPSIMAEDVPTLNLRPVSIPFAAGFSDRFLLSDTISADPSAESRKLFNARRKQRQGTDHEDHCSCCSALASENDALKNRIKQLESHIDRSQASKSKKVEV